MKIKFLGTGASEGIPDLFCRCAVCEKARKEGKKERRTRAGVLIDEDFLIDFSPDFFSNVSRFKIDASKIKNILITHSHSDHFYPEDLVNSMLSSKDRRTVDIYSNETVIEKMREAMAGYELNENFRLHTAECFKTFEAGGRRVTAFNAVHMRNERALLYLIEDGEKTYLHLYDTGEIKDEITEFLKRENKKIDAVAFDCTYGLLTTDYFGHLNLTQIAAACEKFRSEGAFTKDTRIFASHICHWGGSHEELCRAAETKHIEIAYDGMEINL